MFLLESERLILHPLALDQLHLLLYDRSRLETSLRLSPSNLELNASPDFFREFVEAIQQYVIPEVDGHLDQFHWFTHWLVIHREQNVIIGGIGGTGLPDALGQVMVGYFVDKKFEGQGIATEALKTFMEWMFLNPDLKTVIADTYADNIGSQTVLQKNGFVLAAEVPEGLRWKRARK